MSSYVKFLHHEPCPQCGSRNNLGVWSDGHKYCFGCKYYEPGNDTVFSVRAKLAPVTRNGIQPLPEDVSTYIPEVPYIWLKKCLTDQEILKHRIGWSGTRESIMFPVFDRDGELLMWQSRYFGEDKTFPKYLTKGYKGDILHCLGEHSTNRIVLVEDLVSAIVVSRVENSMPLWGSTIHLKTLRQLARYYGQLCIWLDSDKLKEAVLVYGTARLVFDDVRIIRTDEDPKYHNEEQLQKILQDENMERERS